MSAEDVVDTRDAEIARLESRVAELELQLSDQARRSAAVVAEAQEKLYWLERWHVDLDAVMRKPGAIPALDGLKRVRSAIRAGTKLKRRLSGS